MSEDDAALIRRWWVELGEWFNPPSDRDRARLDEIAERYGAEDLVYEEDPVWPDAGSYRGRKEITDRFLEYAELLRIQAIKPGAVIDAGDVVFAEVTIDILGGEAGQSLNVLWGYTMRVEKGKVLHFRAWFDANEGRRAAGLTE